MSNATHATGTDSNATWRRFEVQRKFNVWSRWSPAAYVLVKQQQGFQTVAPQGGGVSGAEHAVAA